MDVDKILAEVNIPDADERQAKRLKMDGEADGSAVSDVLGNGEEDEDEQTRLLRLLEETPQGEEFDLAAMKRQVVALDKRIKKNQEMRVKFADQPTKFLDSEVELHEEIQRAQVLATAPQLYSSLIATGCLSSLCDLLAHDNTDVSIAVVDLIREMTDDDAIGDCQEDGEALVDALLAANLLELLFINVERLNESAREDFDGVQNTLAVLENLCTIKPDASKQVLHHKRFRTWVKARLRQKAFDANKLQASELLAIMLQHSEANVKLWGKEDGIDMLLRYLASYRNKDPRTEEENEMMNNFFDALCSSLLNSDNKTRFLQGEGIELMVIMLRENKLSVFGAMKTLSYSMSGTETAQCRRFVEKLGLKSLFPRFMRTPKKGPMGGSATDFEEHSTTVVASLLKNINDSKLRLRVLNKFVEDDYAKIERLVELLRKYHNMVQAVDKEVEAELEELKEEGVENDNEIKDLFYVRRLNGGLFTLQLVCYILGTIAVAGIPQITYKVQKLLTQDGFSLDFILDNLNENAENIGSRKGSAEAEKEKLHLQGLISKLEQL